MEIFWMITGYLLISLFAVGIEVRWRPIDKLWDTLVWHSNKKILTAESSTAMKIFFLSTWPAAVIGPIVIGIIKALITFLWKLIKLVPKFFQFFFMSTLLLLLTKYYNNQYEFRGYPQRAD